MGQQTGELGEDDGEPARGSSQSDGQSDRVTSTTFDEDPVRTVAGEPAHADCLEDPDGLNDDITPADVERHREQILDGLDEMVPADYDDETCEAYRAGVIDAVVTMDRMLTERGAVEYPED